MVLASQRKFLLSISAGTTFGDVLMVDSVLRERPRVSFHFWRPPGDSALGGAFSLKPVRYPERSVESAEKVLHDIEVNNGLRTFSVWNATARTEPRAFLVCHIAQLLPAEVTIAAKHHINCLHLRVRQATDVTMRPRAHAELPAMFPVEVADDRSVGQCLNGVLEEGVFIPCQRPALCVVAELLEFHSAHGTAFFKDVRGDIVDIRHATHLLAVPNT